MKYLEKTIFAIEKAEDNEKVVHFLGYGYYGEGMEHNSGKMFVLWNILLLILNYQMF